MFYFVFCAALTLSVIEGGVIRSEENNFEVPLSNETLENLFKWNDTLYGELSNTTRSGKTGWYHHFWREKLIAPNVEAGSSSSESADSWSMECDCTSSTRRATPTSSARPTTPRPQNATEATTPPTGNATSARAFDDGSDGDHSWDNSESFEIGDLRWRKKYRTWLRRCGCDKLDD